MNSTGVLCSITAAIFILLFVSSTHAFAEDSPARLTSFCELAKLGKKMNGHTVRIKAIYVSDLMHTSVLKDRRCSADSIAPFVANAGAQDPSAEKFDTALWGSPDDRELRIFSIELSGVYQWSENEKPHGAVTIEKVWSFKRQHGDWRKAS